MKDNRVKVKCEFCGTTSYVLSQKDRGLENIEYVCPNCGKHGTLVVCDLNMGKNKELIDDKQNK